MSSRGGNQPGSYGQRGAKLREIGDSGDPQVRLEQDLASARSELASSEQAREALARELQELAAKSAGTRERLSSEAAEARARVDELARDAERSEARGKTLEDELAATTGERDRARARLVTERGEATARHRRLEQELQDAYRTRAQAAAELAPQAAAIKAANHAREQAQAELRSLGAEHQELGRRLTLRTEELEVVVGRLASVQSVIDSLQKAIEELRSEAMELRSERAGLKARIDAIAIQNDGLSRAMIERDGIIADHRVTIAAHESAEAELRVEVARLSGESERRRARARALQAELAASEDRLDELRTRTVADLQRVAASRAWRWGHGTAKLLRRLTFRRTRGAAGGVERLLAALQAPPELAPPADRAETTEPQ